MVTLAVLILLLFAMKPAMLPFFWGSALAYVSHPIFNFFRRTTGRQRVSAILTLLSIFFVLSVALFVVLPTVISQVQSFVNYLPQLLKKLDAFIYSFLGEHFLKKLHFDGSTLQSLLKGAYLRIGEIPFGDIVQRLFSGVFSVIGLIVNLVLVPLITYYFLVSAGRLKKVYLLLAPEDVREELDRLIGKVHTALSSYLLGQMLIAVFVGIYIATGLYIVGIKYALLIGFVAGVLNMVPYVGFFSGLVPSVLLAIFDNGDIAHLIGVFVVFLTEVGIENLMYPLVMSKATGINPLLVLFAIFVGGYSGGLLGIFIAVPTAVMVVPVFTSFVEKRGGNLVC